MSKKLSNIYYLLLIYLQICFINSASDIKIIYDEFGRPYSSVCFGSKNLCLSLRLDTDYVDTLVHSSLSKKSIKNKYDSSVSKKSTTAKENVEIKYNSKALKADYIRDALVIDSFDIKKFSFYSIKEGDCEDIDKIDGILGLGYATTSNQEKNSLMTQLYVGGSLDSKIWTIDLSDKSKGVINLERKIDSKNVGTDLDLIDNEEGHWLVKIKSILFGKNINKDVKIEFDNDSTMKISTSEIKSSINLDILKKIGDNYFKKLIDKLECKFDTKGKYSTYICDNNNYEDLTSISLIFNDFGINIPKENILIKDKESKKYEFILSNYDGEKNNVLAADLLKGKKIVFDSEKMKLGLYGENMFDTTKVTDDEKPKEDNPIIPKDDDNEKDKEKDKDKDKEKNKEKNKEKEKDKEKENQNEKKEEQPQPQKEIQNQNNDQVKKEEINSSSGILKKIIIFIVIVLVLCIVCTLVKRYKKRKAKTKFPFKSYNDMNLKDIQLVSE